jgi:hypothetical protein
MDEKYLWPLVGVALGWVLSMLATGLRERSERRMRIGLLLSVLLAIRSRVQALNQMASEVEDIARDFEEYEFMLKGMVEDYYLEPPTLIEQLQTRIDELSGLLPVRALELRGLVVLLRFTKGGDLLTSARLEDKRPYAKLRAIRELGFETLETALSRQIRNLAMHHGIITYLQVRLLMAKKQRAGLLGSGFFKQLVEEWRAEGAKRAASVSSDTTH